MKGGFNAWTYTLAFNFLPVGHAGGLSVVKPAQSHQKQSIKT
jgi:hypothetical protein